MTDQWFFPGPPVTSTNKTDRHNIIEIMLKVALKTIKQTKNTVKALIMVLVCKYIISSLHRVSQAEELRG